MIRDILVAQEIQYQIIFYVKIQSSLELQLQNLQVLTCQAKGLIVIIKIHKNTPKNRPLLYLIRMMAQLLTHK